MLELSTIILLIISSLLFFLLLQKSKLSPQISGPYIKLYLIKFFYYNFYIFKF